ncbi:alkyl sulfatase dimerization domain-containing protein [Streptomyces koyangensis]|uniref:alkyl sulfatase dimerization domain-containing protein n=1 Tax=Streptomyces koyangensis TaxID=188770 RepID=UPI003C2DC953
MGVGADAVVDEARTAFGRGDVRWTAEPLGHVVLAPPGHAAAREFLAGTFGQLGHGAENEVWRDIYLSAAAELREGTFGTPTVPASADVLPTPVTRTSPPPPPDPRRRR